MRNISVIILNGVFLYTLCLLCTGCVPAKAPLIQTTAFKGNVVSYDVEFKVKKVGGVDTLVPDTPNRNCPDNNGGKVRVGCVRFEPGTFGIVTFSIHGQGGFKDQQCSDSNSVKWVITQIEATNSGVENKGTFNNPLDGLDAWVTNSYYPLKDADNGLMYGPANVNSAKKSISFINLNAVDNTGSGTLWYRVTVSECGNAANKLTSDPRIENTGLN